MNDVFGPLEGMSLGVVDRHEVINGVPDILERGKVCSSQGRTSKDREAYLDLVEPARMRWGVMEMDILVARQPQVVLRLVRAEVVQDHVDLLARMQPSSSNSVVYWRSITLPAGWMFRRMGDTLSQKGSLMKEGTNVDVTVTSAPSSTKNKENQRDPEMNQMKKGN